MDIEINDCNFSREFFRYKTLLYVITIFVFKISGSNCYIINKAKTVCHLISVAEYCMIMMAKDLG